MQSSLRDVLGWVWQIVLSWLLSITSGLDHHLCLERSTDMVIKATDPEVAVKDGTKNLGEGTRLEKTNDSVLYIERDKGEYQMTTESLIRSVNDETVEENQIIYDNDEETHQIPEQEIVKSAGTSVGVTHSNFAVSGGRAGHVRISEESTDVANKNQSPVEGEALDESNEDSENAIQPFADSIFDLPAVPSVIPSDETTDHVDCIDTQTGDSREDYVNEDDPKDDEEEVDNSVTWMMEVGPTKESYERVLSPQYYCLDFRSAITIGNDEFVTAVKQLRSLLPCLGLGLKRRKKDMWLCLFPPGNINSKMTYGNSNFWDLIANNRDEFNYSENNLLHSFALMRANPCPWCHSFTGGESSTNSEMCDGSSVSHSNETVNDALGESSLEEISDCCRPADTSKVIAKDTCGNTDPVCGEIKSIATGSDERCPTPTSISCSSVDSVNNIPLSVLSVSPVCPEPSSQDGSNCVSESVSCSSTVGLMTVEPTPSVCKGKSKSFPYNYRLVVGIPQALAGEESVNAICDGFILKLDTLLLESTIPGSKALFSSNTMNANEQNREGECDEKAPITELEIKSKSTGCSESSGEANCISSKSSEVDCPHADKDFDKIAAQLNLTCVEKAKVIQQLSVIRNMLVTNQKCERDAKGKEPLPKNNVDKSEVNSPHITRTLDAPISKNFINKCKSERVSFISGFATCMNAAISKTLVNRGFWKENGDFHIGHSISHCYNLDDLSDQEWHDHPDDDDNDEDDDDDDDVQFSLCCRKPTVSLSVTSSHGLRPVWETARMIDKTRKDIQSHSRNAVPQIIPLDLENSSVSDSQFPSVFQPESNFSIANITDFPSKRHRRLQSVEMLSFQCISPIVIFFMTTCITLRVRDGILTFSFYHQHQFVRNSIAYEFADEIESALIRSFKVL